MTPAALKSLLNDDVENAVIAMTPGGIEAQEKRGQMGLVGTPGKLPREGTSNPEDRARWQALGFAFGEPIDALWVAVTFPPGWKVEPSGHSMWSDVLDGKGRRRAGLFYKAAFYDMSAHVRLEPRYSCGRDYDRKDCLWFGLRDGDKFTEEWETLPAESNRDYDALRAAEDRCREKLKKRFPDHKNPLAYWA